VGHVVWFLFADLATFAGLTATLIALDRGSRACRGACPAIASNRPSACFLVTPARLIRVARRHLSLVR